MGLLDVPRVLPSVMAADLMRPGEQVDALLGAGCRVFHVDVMDGRFVPNLTLGTGFAAALAPRARAAGGMLDVHLMVDRPGLMIERFAPHAGSISVHPEADPQIHRRLAEIREAGCLAGLALSPGTPPSLLAGLLDVVDYVNVMGVDPGFSGQDFIATTPDRIAAVRALVPPDMPVEVDGGIHAATLPLARDAGASLFVSASGIFGHDDPVAAYRELAGLAGGG
ncbi:MAG TPA: ribulose-phosphate 3-epimerase [Miltoncostaeaceae bacterium]|nr:ribulose-phosphate 3-epimerase [Miltoncostaeaceae bacterium]